MKKIFLAILMILLAGCESSPSPVLKGRIVTSIPTTYTNQVMMDDGTVRLIETAFPLDEDSDVDVYQSYVGATLILKLKQAEGTIK